MLRLRSERLARGERTIGWKLGFGAPAALERFELSSPLVGFMTDASLRPSGATVSCAGWKRPVAEPEVAVHIGSNVSGGEGYVAGSIAALGAAIELADVDPPPEDVEVILAGNIFHRAVVLGEPDGQRAGGRLEGLEAHVIRNGVEVATTMDLEALTGELHQIVRDTAHLLAQVGTALRAGDVIITGSVIPPLSVEPGDEIAFELTPFPAISVRV